jgi:hypothetical protein
MEKVMAWWSALPMWQKYAIGAAIAVFVLLAVL